MENFYFYNPTKIHFGKGAISETEKELAGVGKNILITYGGGSIKKNGIYDSAIEILKKLGKNVYELSGIMPNPRTTKVLEGVELCKKYNIDFLLAIGGGSTIDCTKAIASAFYLDDPNTFFKDLYIDKKSISKALPFGTIATMASTGSEMDAGGVITDWENNMKMGYLNELLFPKFSILDPTYTYSMPINQTIYGTIDMISHTLETYFSEPDTPTVADAMAEGFLKNVFENLKVVVNDTHNYVARANLMWSSSMALMGVFNVSKKQDWLGHMIEHALSAFYDIPHGAGLAIVHPAYLKYICKNKPAKFVRFARTVWGITEGTEEELALKGLEKLTEFFKFVGAPITLKEVGIGTDKLDDVIEQIVLYPTSYSNLDKQDLKNILLSCAE